VVGACIDANKTCKEILDNGGSVGDGPYLIDPDGAGALPPVQVYCVMSAGGHTVYAQSHDWGEWGSNMTIVMRDGLTPTTGSIPEWDATCALFGKSKYAGGWKNNGGTYSQPGFQVYADSQDWWNNDAKKVFPSVTYNDFVILQDALSTDCWAHYAEAGSLQSFGSPGGSGYAFCRGGATASKRYHIYLCLP
jgi:hypothetical protein